MKNFCRENLLFSLCGLNCGLCPMRIGNYCPGCGGGLGNQPCAIAKCSLAHNQVEYCFQCSEYPCEKFEGIGEYDSFITHQRQLLDIIRAQEIGIEEYNEEQRRKLRTLRLLLDEYNDGRKKSFYCTAINLLPLKETETLLDDIFADTQFHGKNRKEKVESITLGFQRLAEEQGVVLKLRKKLKSQEPI